MQVRPFRLLSGSVLAAVERELGAAVRNWADQWGIASTALSFSVQASNDAVLDDVRWRQHWQQDERALWLSWQAPLLLELQTAIFPADHGNPASQRPRIAPQGAEQALDALLALLVKAQLPGSVAAVRSTQSEPPESVFAHASGALVLQISLGKQRCYCLLNDAAVQAFLEHHGVRPSLHKLGILPKLNYLHALRHTSIRLPVTVGEAQVALGNLLTVGIGDVIRLDAAIDGPVRVMGPHGGRLFDAYLGKVQDSVAVELVSREP